MTLDRFIPIALCKVVYKIISKIIENRLKPLLPTLVSEEQTRYVEGRKILNNIRSVSASKYTGFPTISNDALYRPDFLSTVISDSSALISPCAIICFASRDFERSLRSTNDLLMRSIELMHSLQQDTAETNREIGNDAIGVPGMEVTPSH